MGCQRIPLLIIPSDNILLVHRTFPCICHRLLVLHYIFLLKILVTNLVRIRILLNSPSTILPCWNTWVGLILLDMYHVISCYTKRTWIGFRVTSLFYLRNMTAGNIMIWTASYTIIDTLYRIVMWFGRLSHQTCHLKWWNHEWWHFDGILNSKIYILLNLLVFSFQITYLWLNLGQSNSQELILSLLGLYWLFFISLIVSKIAYCIFNVICLICVFVLKSK